MHSLEILSDKFSNFSPRRPPMGWGRAVAPYADTTKFSKFSRFLSAQCWHVCIIVQNFRLLTAHVKFHQICTLIGSFCWKYIKFQRSYILWHWRVKQNLKKKRFVVLKMTRIWWVLIWKIWNFDFHRLKKSDFILESKMVELHQNTNSKQPDRPDAMWKLYFTLEINE